MNKAIQIIFILTLISTSIFGQKNFIKGEVVTHDGVTLEGFINYRNWALNPGFISFKENNSKDIEIYSPSEIKSFKVSDERYIAVQVDVETSRMEYNNLSSTKEFSFEKKLVFLQTIIQGEKSLYQYKSSGKTSFYIQEGSTFMLLNYKKYLNSREVVKENRFLDKSCESSNLEP